MSENPNRDRSMIKIFKDLMITKRDLVDLRQSIFNTIQSIKHSDHLIMHIQSRRKTNNHNFQSAPQIIRPAAPPLYLPLNSNIDFCQICLRQFQRPSQLTHHMRQQHNLHRHSCSDCGNLLVQGQQSHEMNSCPEKKTVCQFCKFSIKLKDLDEHMKICSFKECYKCNKQIYARAYSFHLQHCHRLVGKNAIVPCKRIKHVRLERPLVLPCCLVTQYD